MNLHQVDTSGPLVKINAALKSQTEPCVGRASARCRAADLYHPPEHGSPIDLEVLLFDTPDSLTVGGKDSDRDGALVGVGLNPAKRSSLPKKRKN